jgi:dTDP-4-amino-4,6-dideoxygalactose transaminase
MIAKVRYRYLERNDFLNKNNINKLNNFLYSGKYILNDVRTNFEEAASKYLKNKYSVGVSSGTNALYLALKAINLKKNDEVLVPCLSWISTFTAVEMTGAKAVGIDINENLSMNLDQIKSKINKKTKAIIFVHFSGLTTDLTKLSNFCKRKKIFLIEDSAQSFGGKINKKFSGTFGDFGAYSLNPMKVFSSIGEAGLITFNNKKYYKKLELLRYSGIQNKEKCIVPELNHKIDNIQCFILRHKIKDINKIIKKRISIAENYEKRLTNKIDKPIFKKDFSHIYYGYTIKTNKRNKLKQFLHKNKIETKIEHPYLICDHKPFKKNNKLKNFKKGNEVRKTILSLPIDENMTKKEINYTIKKINEFFKYE